MENQTEPRAIRPWLIIALVIVILAAVGFFGWNYYQNTKNTAVVKPTVSTTTPSTVSTADWKTYTNDTYGFSFKYPVNFPVKTISADGLQLCIDSNALTAESMTFCQDASGMSISAVTNTQNLSLDAFAKSRAVDNTTYKYENIKIGILSGIKSIQTSVCDGVGCDYGTYYFQNGNTIVVMFYTPENNNDAPTFSAILNSFQFTK